MTKSARDEQGFALITAIILLMVMFGLGLGLLLFTDNQQRASAREQASESAFTVAEAALNGQIGQLARAWPSSAAEAYPDTTNGLVRCTAAVSTATNGCPSVASLNSGYPNISPVPCAAGEPSETWGSPLTNQWTTYVRDNGGGTTSLYNSTIDQAQPGWDQNGDGKLWVRSVGVAQCRHVEVVTLVSRELVPLNFPHNAATGNWFKTTNNGKKVIIDTQGSASQPGGVSMRCTVPHPEPCKDYEAGKGQISPDTTNAEPSPTPTLSASQLESLRNQAESTGHYYPAGTCPTGLPSGAPVYVEGPCAVSGGGNEVANSSGSPGFLVIVNGTFSIGGTQIFYGEIYAVNQQNSSAAVISLGGNAEIVGGAVVDGNGGIDFGSSSTNLVYDPTAINELKTSAGAAATRNSFRVLPNSQ